MALIEARGVTKRFGGLAAVSEVTFDLQDGEILGLIGPNGSGKTTLVNVITGALPYSGGDVRLRGDSLRGRPSYAIGRLGVTLGAARRSAEEVLDFVSLAHRAGAPADGLNVPERKRMELARALAMRPTVLFLDEVMAGLNPSEIDAAVALIKRIRDRGTTLVVIEHVMKAIRDLSDRILVLFHGEKLTEGPPGEVLNNPEVVSAYLGRRYAEQSRA